MASAVFTAIDEEVKTEGQLWRWGSGLYTVLHLVRTNEGVMNVTRSGQADHGDLVSNTSESFVSTPVYVALRGMKKGIKYTYHYNKQKPNRHSFLRSLRVRDNYILKH